jgi:hypothetical protein
VKNVTNCAQDTLHERWPNQLLLSYALCQRDRKFSDGCTSNPMCGFDVTCGPATPPAPDQSSSFPF